MKVAAGVDDDRLTGHGLGAAHRDHHVGAVVLVGGFFSSEVAAEFWICSAVEGGPHPPDALHPCGRTCRYGRDDPCDRCGSACRADSRRRHNGASSLRPTVPVAPTTCRPFRASSLSSSEGQPPVVSIWRQEADSDQPAFWGNVSARGFKPGAVHCTPFVAARLKAQRDPEPPFVDRWKRLGVRIHASLDCL